LGFSKTFLATNSMSDPIITSEEEEEEEEEAEQNGRGV
jgi:hypothetical protein